MHLVRAAAAALALTALAAPAAAHGPGPHGDGYRDRDVQYLWLGNARLFDFDRLSRHKGFFDHGRVAGPGVYDYDRGYPYDHYDGDRGGYAEAYAEEDYSYAEEPEWRHTRCSEQWVPHKSRRDRARVTVCRN